VKVRIQFDKHGAIRFTSHKDVVRIFERAFAAARKAGIRFINVDIMCGLPGQDAKVYLHDVKRAIALRPDMIHNSVFMPTPFTGFSQRR